jgi:hypothetical protein
LLNGSPILLKYGLKVKIADTDKEVELIDNRKPRTIGDLMLECVTTPLQKDNDDKDGTNRLRLFNLAQEIYKNKDKTINLKAEDIVEIKDRALKLFLDPQTYAGIVNAIDPDKEK